MFTDTVEMDFEDRDSEGSYSKLQYWHWKYRGSLCYHYVQIKAKLEL